MDLIKVCYFLNTFAFLMLVNGYLEYKYPEKYEQIIISTSFNLIYIYSHLEIFSYKLYNINLKSFVDKFLKKKNQKNNIIQIKNNGDNHIKYCTDNIDDLFVDDGQSIYIFSDNEKAYENKCVNKIISHSPKILTNYEESNVNFLLFEVNLSEKNVKIDLKTNNYNYYIVNNIIDKKFIIYYLINSKILAINDELHTSIKNDTIKVKIIDSNVNVKELEITDKKFITIKKDEYIY